MAEQEFIVRVPPRDENKKYHVMKFRASLNQDFSKWTGSKMVRENNEKILKSNIPENEDPKFGAGSVFGKDMKEELRLKKLGITRKKYNPDAQPWLMRINGKGGRKYKGIREGGVSENTSFYVFTHGKDGAFEAFPISEWYNFTPIQRYKTLDADEAEEQYANRGKILNKWAVMVNKKVRNDDEGDGEDPDDEESKGKKSKKKGENFKVSDMDDWDEDGGDALDTSDDEKEKKESDSDSDTGGKRKKSKDTKKKKKKNKTDVDEAFEDSDDGDDEGREVDYMSDESSESEEELEKEHDIKGIDQDEGISKMLDSDESSEDEDKKKSDDEDDEDETGKKKKGKGESGDEDEDKKGKKKKKGSSAANSRSATPTKEMEKQERDQKRKALVANVLDPNAAGESAAKKSRLEQFGASSSSAISSSAFADVTEEAVRRYLRRRPMTTGELLKKFKSKKEDRHELVKHLANIIKKINPDRQKKQGILYLSLVDQDKNK